MKSVTVGWFEIPVSDMDRAIAFYQKVFGVNLERHQMGTLDMAWFPWDENGTGAGGTLIGHPDHYVPSKEGVLIYFNSENITDELAKIDHSGGTVVQGKTQISPEVGYMAVFIDTEGNRIALHSKA
jgi:predicted enzyme related to lactoylglutathione lyase